MNIKITAANTEIINAALAKANGKATSFTVTSYSYVEAVAAEFEKILDKAQLTKGNRQGIEGIYLPAGPTANAYKYKAKSTQLTLRRRSSGWYLVSVDEAFLYPKAREQHRTILTQSQADEIARKALEPFLVRRSELVVQASQIPAIVF